MTCATLPCSYIVRTFQKPISVVVFALTAPVVMTAASFRLWPLSVIRILLPAEFLVFSLSAFTVVHSAFTVAHGMDSGGSFCTVTIDYLSPGGGFEGFWGTKWFLEGGKEWDLVVFISIKRGETIVNWLSINS